MSQVAWPTTSPAGSSTHGQSRSAGTFKSPSLPPRRASLASPLPSPSSVPSAPVGPAGPSGERESGPSQAVSLSLSLSDPSAKPKVRASRACSSCNRQKLRCDGGKPCSRCVSLKTEDACEYLPSLRGKTRKRKDRSGGAKAGGDDSDERKTRRRTTSPDSLRDLRDRDDGVRGLDENEQFQRWKRDTALAQTGARNSTLWGPEPPPPPPTITNTTAAAARAGSFHSSPGSRPRLDSKSTPLEMRGSNPNSIDKYTTLPLPGDAHNPLAVLAEASATAHSDTGASPHDAMLGGLGSGSGGAHGPGQTGMEGEEAGYYAPVERAQTNEAPHIMSLINVHEAERLFEMYFRYLHPYLPFLDKEHSAPSRIARRNNFLFNAICCVAARAFDVVLWARLKEFAKFEMERLPKEKNIDVVQGHLIYATWNLIRPKNFEQDMSWLRVGVASRTAIDINLHRVALLKQAREGLPTWLTRSIIRTWLLSYIIDRTLSAQLGKPSSMRGENSVRKYAALITDGDDFPTEDDVWVAALAEWTQLLGRALDTFRSSAASRPGSPSSFGPLSSANDAPFPDLVHVFTKQFQQWRHRSEASARRFGAEDKATRFMIGNIRLYEGYARLVLQSFALQRAMDSTLDLPAAFAEASVYQSAAMRLIGTFESDVESTGLTRGCPDFAFTVLTYAAVSLLKALQPQFAHLDPNRPSILTTSRKAADMLARAAMTADHLPASQSVFLSRLIEAKSAEPALPPTNTLQGNTGQTPWVPETIDFEALGHAIDAEQTTALWPPMPAMPNSNANSNSAGINGWESFFDQVDGQAVVANHDPATQPMAFGQTNMAGFSAQGTAATTTTNGPSTNTDGSGAVHPPTDLSSWVAQNAYQGTVPGAEAALGLGGLGIGAWGDGDMLFTQDSFWKSILEGTQIPAPGMV